MLIDAANAIQIGLTLTFAALVVALLRTWAPAVWEATEAERWTATNWLSVGIVVGFLFNLFDWSYWAVTWVVVLFDLPQEETMMRWGPVSNLLLRQAPSIYAVYCHLEAARLMHSAPELRVGRWLVAGIALAGGLLVASPSRAVGE